MSELGDLLKQLSEQSSSLLSAVTSDVSSSEKDAKAQAFIQSSSETFKAVKSLTDDVAALVRGDNQDQKAIVAILRDCVESLKSVVVQNGVYARNYALGKGDENLQQLRESIQALEDASRGVLETYQALSMSEFAGHIKAKQTIPVTVITGFLGSGKTTLLNYILTKNHGKRIAVIENEYGEIGIDDLLIKDKFVGDEEIFLMNNGCICCTVRGDLIRTLGSLMEQSDKFDYILLETTGLADPAPIAQTFFTVPEIGSKLRMDGIITVCDAKHLVQHLDEKKPDGAVNESVEQIAFADRILLNKTDLVTKEELEEVKHRIRAINKVAEIIPTVKSVIDIEKILNIRAFDLDKITDVDPDFLLAKEDEECGEDCKECGEDCKLDHKHHHHDKGHKHKEHKEKDETQKPGKHDNQVGSVGLSVVGDLDMEKLNAWMGRLLREQGANIYRMKGVLSVRGMDSRYVFQGVHMIFDGNPGSPWDPNEVRQNKIVFIGKGLDRAALDKGLRACLAA